MRGNFDFAKGTSRFESRIADGEGDNIGDITWWGKLSHREVKEAARDIWNAGPASWDLTGNPVELVEFAKLADSTFDDRWSLHALHLVSRINLSTAHQAYESALEMRVEELETILDTASDGLARIIDKYNIEELSDSVS